MAFLLLLLPQMNTRSKKGFTLLEIMIAVGVIGLLAAIAIPSMRSARQKSRATRFAREIQAAGHAFVQYAMDNGGYPADKTPAQMPDGMAPYLAKFPWVENTVIGGQWDWDYQQFGVYAAVSVKSPDWNNTLMQQVDATFDDGNLSTGQFRSRTDGYMYVLEE